MAMMCGMGKSPRVSVTLDPETWDSLAALSAANGESMSAIVRGLVGAVAPAMGRVAELIEAGSSARAQLDSAVGTSVDDAEEFLSLMMGAWGDEA